MKNFDVIVIGGGPSGIFSAITAAERGFTVALFEKNKRIGNKILVAGSGKCNITHEGKPKDFLKKYGMNGKFLKEALNKYSPDMLKDFFRDNGLPLTLIEESGKYFPTTFSSLDVIEVLERKIKFLGIEIINNAYDIEIKLCEKSEEKINDIESKFVVKCNKNFYTCKNIVLATGGKSFPGIGTTGDGYIIAKSFGHKIIPPKPALTPIFVKDYKFSELSGISFKNIKISIFKDGKQIINAQGPLLFTHTNFSGPVILDNSRYVDRDCELVINYLDKSIEKLNRELIEEANIDGKRTLKKILLTYNLPERFIKTILEVSGIDETLKISELSKSDRENISKLLISDKMKISKVGNFEVAMVTSGGISLDEISNKTMESKLVKRLYFVGEVLDIDGDTGGYNIQAACSTGVLAGKSIREEIHDAKG